MHRELLAADGAGRHLLTDAVEPTVVVDHIRDRLRDGSLRVREG